MGKDRDQDETDQDQDEPAQTQGETIRTHYTETEIERIQGFIDERYSNKEIATEMNRTVPGIRCLRHRLKLTKKAQVEIPILTNQRDALTDEIIDLRIKISLVTAKLDGLKKEIVDHEVVKKEYLELKTAVDYYHANRDQISREIRATVQNEADAVAIIKIFSWFDKK